MAHSSRYFRAEFPAVLALLLGACRAECPAFPPAGKPASQLARAEGQVLARVFPQLLKRQPRGNVVFVAAFCAASSVELEPALGLAPAAGSSATRVVSRLGFDVRGTFNHPERSLPSPQAEHDVQRRLRPAALTLDDPFFVTVHDRETGSIIYVAWIREAGVAASCQ
jgi:hypothetical protein